MNGKRFPQSFSSIARSLSRQEGSLGVRLGQLLSLREKWTNIAGKVVSENVQIVTVKEDGTLILGTESSVWLQEINCLRFQILGRIKESFPRFGINKIKIRIVNKLIKGQVQAPEKVSVKPGKLTVAENRHMKDVLRRVSDPELQDVLERIFIKSTSKDS